MIVNYYISKNEELGIFHILVNLAEKWQNFQIESDPFGNPDRVAICFFVNDNDYYVEYFQMPKGFDYFDYLLTSMIEKDQIIIIAVSKKALIDKNVFKII